MHTYAVVGYFGYETEEYFKSMWKGLSDNNITQYGVETKGLKPHITIADYDNLDKNRYIKLLDEFYDDKPKIDISLNILGTFINSGTMFVAPTISNELLCFHTNHHNFFKVFNENNDSLYLPGRWSPHCTIASRLGEDNMLRAFSYCRNKISRINCKINEIALIEIELNDDGIAVGGTDIFLKKLK